MKSMQIVFLFVVLLAAIAFGGQYVAKVKYILNKSDPNLVEVSTVLTSDNSTVNTCNINFSSNSERGKRIYAMLLSAQANEKTLWLNVDGSGNLVECSIYTQY